MSAKVILKSLVLTIIVLVVLAVIPFGTANKIHYIERISGESKIEKVYGESWLVWLYNNPVGELSTYAFVKRKFLSDWYGSQMDLPSSKDKIPDFVENYNIDLNICQKKDFNSFNDFFYRKLKKSARIIDTNSLAVVSPADGKVLAYSDISNQDFIVKGYRFDVDSYFNNKELSNRYRNASLMIIRLCPTDYHRYHFPISGKILNEELIEGDYYSVSPIALKKKIELLTLNKRAYTEIETKNFGRVIMSEVAATMVGSMINTYDDGDVEKGEEKGYFKFGGSTVILFFEKGEITIDKDLMKNTSEGLETEIKMGERIAIGEL